jgi:hypothetical protein
MVIALLYGGCVPSHVCDYCINRRKMIARITGSLAYTTVPYCRLLTLLSINSNQIGGFGSNDSFGQKAYGCQMSNNNASIITMKLTKAVRSESNSILSLVVKYLPSKQMSRGRFPANACNIFLIIF